MSALAHAGSDAGPLARASTRRPVVLVLIGAYWPGHDATGPNQSLRSLAQALAPRFEFKVIARDRPFGANEPIAATGRWHDAEWASFRYCRVSPAGAVGLARLLSETPHDLLMMNGFFDREFTLPALIARRTGRAPRTPAILSTRGEFADGALGLKSARKAGWLVLARRAGLLGDVWLHATGPREAADIERGFPYSRGVLVAPNVRLIGAPLERRRMRRSDEPLRLAFLGRISRVKNLDYALAALLSVRAPVTFDVYGPVQDAEHWAECQAIVARLPANVRVTLKGEIANAQVQATLADYDALFLPTRGENFGHAILDALTAGIPVLISDQTPFQDLEAHSAGWSLPLSDPGAFVAALEKLAAMPEATYAGLAHGARRLAETVVGESDAVGRNIQMLAAAMAGGAR